jgi:hypothetical protein
MDLNEFFPRKTAKMWIVVALLLLPLILKLIDSFLTNPCLFSSLEQTFFPGSYGSIRYVLSAMMQSVASILALILTVPLILLQSTYKHAKIIEFFLKRREIGQVLLFASSVVVLSALVLSNIKDGEDLAGMVYFLAFYSVYLFVFLFPLIYYYWKFCARCFSSGGLLEIIGEERSQKKETLLGIIEVLFEVLKKAVGEGNMNSIEKGCNNIENIFNQIYLESTTEDRESIFRNLRDVAGKSIESGPGTLRPFTDLFVNFMKVGARQNEELTYFEKIFEFVEPIIVEAVGPEQSEALDNYRGQLDGLERLIEEIQPHNAADYAVIIGDHWNRIVLASLNKVLGGST